MPYVTVDGRRLFYVRRPAGCRQGPTILWIHGAGGNALLWGDVLQNMPGVAAVAPDLPGHGRSAGPGAQTIGPYADAILGAAEALQLGDYLLAGHSLGGAVALEAALRRPPGLCGLVLISVTARLLVSPDLLRNLVDDPGAARQWIVDTGYSPEAPARTRQLGARQLAEMDSAVLHGDFLACSRFDARAHLRRIGYPALVLCGGEDRLTPPKYVRALQEGLPDARFELVPSAGHMLPLECPKGVAAATLRFLESL